MSKYLKILSCKHYNTKDVNTVFSNGFVTGNSFDTINTNILIELKNKSANIGFLYNTVENNTPLYNGVVGDFTIQDALFNSEITNEQTAFSGFVNANQGVVTQLQKSNPISGFSDKAKATIELKYETPLISATASWLIATPYLKGDYVIDGGSLYVAILDSTGNNPITTVGFWFKVNESFFIYELLHTWKIREYLPETDTNLGNFVTPINFSGGNSVKYIFRTEFKDSTFTSIADKSSERVVSQYFASQVFAIDDYVLDNNLVFRSLANANSGNTPSSSPASWVLDNDLDLNKFMQPSNVGFFNEKYNGMTAKYSLQNATSPTSIDIDNELDVVYIVQLKNNEGDFTTDTKITVHSILERNGSDFDTQLNSTQNSLHKKVTVISDGTTTQNIGNTIIKITATVNSGDTTLLDLSFTIAADSYQDRFVVFVTPVQNVIIGLPLDCGTNQNSGGAGLTNKKYEGYADGVYTIDYDMLNQPDSLIVYYFNIATPTVRTILATTSGAVSNSTGSPLSFTTIAANSVNGDFYIEVEGEAAGTVWYYTLNCPTVNGTGTATTSFSEHNNIWISAYNIVETIFNDLKLTGGCNDFNFYYHYDDANSKDGLNEFKGFVNDFVQAKFELTNTNPARTVISQFQIAIKAGDGSIIESVIINSSELNFSKKTNVTFTNNDKSNISLTNNSGVYSGVYSFVVKKDWLQYTDVVMVLTVAGDIIKINTTSPLKKDFTSNVFGLGGLNQTKNTSLEPVISKYDGSIQFWTTDETTQLTAPLNTGLTRVIAIFKEINLGSLQAILADLTGFIYVNASGGITDNQYIHDRANVLQSNSPFIPIAPSIGAEITIDAINATIVRIKSDYDADKAKTLFNSCVNIGARLDKVDANPPPTSDAIISMYFSGNFAGNTQTIELSEKLINLSVNNIFNLAATYTIKYSDTNVVPDWTLITAQSAAQIQTAIDSGTNNYLLNFEVQSYTSFSKAVLTLKYLTFNPVATVQVVLLNQVSQDIWIGIPPNITIQLASIVSANTPASIFHFGFKISANDDFTIYDLDLAGLNALLLSTADNIERMIIIYSVYQAPNTSEILTFTFN